MLGHSVSSVAITSLCLAFAGCRTGLNVSPVQGGSVPQGQVYFLPRAEYTATLDRELVQCEAQLPLDSSAHKWLEQQVGTLSNLSSALRRSALLGQHPKCQNAPQMRNNLGNAFDRVAELLPSQPPAACAKQSDPAFAKAYQDAFRGILRDFLADPVFNSDVDWSPCPETARDVHSLGDSADPQAKLAELNQCAQAFARETVTTKVLFNVAMQASLEAHNLPDLEHAYTIDYQEMSGGTKKTEYLVEKYPNGTLKSVNATIDDRTAQVIQGTLRGVLNLAAASGGFPLTFPPVPAGAQVELPLAFAKWGVANAPAPLCKAEIVQLLRQRAELDKKVGQVAARVLALVKQAEEATAAAGQRTVEADEAQKQLDGLPAADPGRKALEDKIAKLKAEAKAQTAKADQLAKDKASLEKAQGEDFAAFAAVRKKLTLSVTQLFKPEASDELAEAEQKLASLPQVDAQRPILEKEIAQLKATNEQTLRGAKEAASRWLNDQVSYCKGSAKPVKKEILDCEGEIPILLKASMASYLVPQKPSFSPGPPTPQGGLVYREPAQGLLLVCQSRPCLDDKGRLAVSPKDTLLVISGDFPQLGVLAQLPLTNRTFQNNTLEASFSPSGSLQKLKYVSNARAEAAAQAFESASSDILAFTQAKKAAKKTDLEAQKAEVDAEKALLDAQLAREKSRKALEDFLNPPAPEE